MSVKKREKREKYRKRATLTTNADIPPLWIIMLYIAADSNLAKFAIESLKQLNVTAGPDVRVVVQFAVDAPGLCFDSLGTRP